jgi:2-succinyl-5-enolpyruvyl-6-hydroxy-3-cyclohexene-1-carboxylate synthase
MVEELVRLGVNPFFVAPGSRSTPLTVAAARHPDAHVVLHVDERGTSFAALGAGRLRRRPAAWITTSGTAVANGTPAVVEASMDDVPLLLLTADRPPERSDTGANQTIDQTKIYGDYVRWHASVPPPTASIDPSYVLTTMDQAVHRATRAPSGPVHLNCAFRKPLAPTQQDEAIAVPEAVADWAEEDAPFTTYPASGPTPAPEAMAPIAAAVERTDRGLVVAGRLDTPVEAEAARRLSERLGWPLVPDITSHLRLGAARHPLSMPYTDLLLTSDAFQRQYAPEVVLQVGGRFASKRLRHYLRDHPPAVRAVVRPTPARADPDHRVTHHVESTVSGFGTALLERTGRAAEPSDWRSAWSTAHDRAAQAIRTRTIDSDRLSEPVVAASISAAIPDEHTLVAANSMPVRDLNRHAVAEGAPVPVVANRGASGIDGTVATAAGAAHGRDAPVTLLIGDLALWHDLNSLALLRNQPVVVVVVNNDGGGIFHFLPIREHEDVFEPYFTTPQGRSFGEAAAAFDLSYEQPETPAGFRSAYAEACDRAGPTLIEVRTDRDENERLHTVLEQEVAEAVGTEIR